MKTLKDLVRPNIWQLAASATERESDGGNGGRILLNANENPYNDPYNRYPDPMERELRGRLSATKQVEDDCIFVGNGAEEAIDMVFRVFCRPQVDNVVAIEPTCGFYRKLAAINDVAYRPVLLDGNYQMQASKLLAACDKRTKAVFICSPNNPTGNNMQVEEVEKVLRQFGGIVVVDETYSDFSTEPVFRKRLSEFPNLIAINTMSKAWGCAAIGLGMAFASKEIVDIYNKVKRPHAVNMLTQRHALEAIDDKEHVEKWVRIIIQERNQLMVAFDELKCCEKVFPSEANFFLARMADAKAIYDYLASSGIMVRDCSGMSLCGNCLRITVGSKSENSELLGALRRL